MQSLSLALRLARRELRSGLKGFKILILCLALGVATIAGVGSLSDALVAGLAADGGKLLGGDVELRLTHRTWMEEHRSYLEENSRAISRVVNLRTMALPVEETTATAKRALVELKSVDDLYPLYGELELRDGADFRPLLEQRDGVYGAVVERAVLRRLGLQVGQHLQLGELKVQLRAVIAREPDRGADGFMLGPRVMISSAAMAETGLIREGSLIRYHYRLLLAEGQNLDAWREALNAAFPDAGWRLRDLRNGAPGIRRFLDRMRLFLTLVGLSALLVGGLGVANAVKAYLDGKVRSIAIYKCIGAPNRLIFSAYLIQVLVISLLGIFLGLLVGAAAPALLADMVAPYLPFEARINVFGTPLFLAAGFGVLTSLTFAFWPLTRSRDIPAGALFRDVTAPVERKSRWLDSLVMLVLVASLAGLAIWNADMKRFAILFVSGAVLALVGFYLAGQAIVYLTRLLPRFANARLRLAFANLHRPGAPTLTIAISFGLGLSVLVTVVALRANLAHLINDRLPESAPAYFFLDVLPEQAEQLDRIAASVEGVGKVVKAPSLRGRIVAIKGVPADKITPKPEVSWVLRGDRGITYSRSLPEGSSLVEGEWWPEDYNGPPLISMDAKAAEGLGVTIGDSLTVNILGRELEARVHNLRRIDWSTFGINFVLIFSPGMLERAPHTFMATVTASEEAELPLEDAVAEAFPNVTAIRVRDAIETANNILRNIDAAVGATAALTLISGILVLAGAIAAGHRRRVFESVVLKVLGARRRDVITTYLVEYLVLGIAIGAMAALVGGGGAWYIVTRIMGGQWVLPPLDILSTIIVAVVVSLSAGMIATWAALSQKPAPLLRNE